MQFAALRIGRNHKLNEFIIGRFANSFFFIYFNSFLHAEFKTLE